MYYLNKIANNMNMIYLYIFLFILLILIMMPLRVRIIKNDKKSDVDIFLIKLFNIRIDFDDFIRLLLTTKEDRYHITVHSVIQNIKGILRFSNVLNTACSLVTLNKLTLIIKNNITNDDINHLVNFVSWNAISVFQYFIYKKFKKVKNEYYMVRRRSMDEEININFECTFNIRVITIIYVFLRNIKDIPRVYKAIKKEVKK